MSIHIVKKEHQAVGEFNGGEIQENKPIGFPREGGELNPYSNLFYWAHAWSDNGSTIGLHPHQGFEIMSFVTEGSIEHYDTAHKEWRRLEKGAAQIIRSGSGISHSEKINAGGNMFQIWFDPNLNQSIQQPASYDDYSDEVFPVTEKNGIRTKVYRGDGSPLQMQSKGVEIVEKFMEVGEFSILLNAAKMHSIYVVNGAAEFEGQGLIQNDFAIVKEQSELKLKVTESVQLFIISSKEKLTYKTYAESYGR
jgi:redox-sensitive bicupin YhaK (pirin superfamily)